VPYDRRQEEKTRNDGEKGLPIQKELRAGLRGWAVEEGARGPLWTIIKQ